MALTTKERKQLQIATGSRNTGLDVANLINATEVKVATVTLNASQMRNLHATPVKVVDAPGVGKANVLVRSVAKMVYKANGYNSVGGSDDLALRYTDASGTLMAQFETTGFLDQTSDQVRVAFPTGTGGTAACVVLTPLANAAIVASILTGEIASSDVDASGDSPVTITCYYVEVAV